MLYWAIWPATGIAFLCVFSLFVLPSVVKNTRAAFKTEAHRRKYAWLAAFSLSCALEVGLLCFIIAAFVDRAQNGFPLGAGWAGAHVVWPVYVFAGVATALCAAGAVYIELREKRDMSRGKSSEPSPSPCREVRSASIRKGQKRELPEPVPQSAATETQKPAVGERDKCRAAIHITAAILLTVCVLSAASILTVIFNYILLKLFSASVSKKILLIMAGLEFVAFAIAAVIVRKKIRRLKLVLRIICAILFAIFWGEFFLFSFAPKEVIESILVWAGSGTVVAAPMLAFVWLVYALGVRKRPEPFCINPKGKKRVKGITDT